MRISGFTTVRPNMPATRTYEDFSKFWGESLAQIKPGELLETLQMKFSYNG